MSKGITGRTHLEIEGHRRALVCDMNAVDALYQQHGEGWQLWLAERFLGEAVPGAPEGTRRLIPLTPAELIDTLYALLSTDIEDREAPLTRGALRRAFGVGDLPEVMAAVTGAVLAGFHLPGETIEAVVNAVAGPRK